MIDSLRGRMYRWADRWVSKEYEGEVSPQDPFVPLIIGLCVWGVVLVSGLRLFEYLLPTWMAAILGLIWVIPSWLAAKWANARYHGMTIPEYQDYLNKRTDKHFEEKDRARFRRALRSVASAAERTDHAEFPVEYTYKGYRVTIEESGGEDA